MRLFQRHRQVRTGNLADDDLLAQLKARGESAVPRHWVHFLYVADESSARAAAAEVISDGWDLDRIEPVTDARGWMVVAEQYDAVLSPERVVAARRFFEGLADRSNGGDYGGWRVEG